MGAYIISENVWNGRLFFR